MASFGSFETDREVYSGPTYTVYSARKEGDPKTEYAIKVFSLHQSGLEPESGSNPRSSFQRHRALVRPTH